MLHCGPYRPSAMSLSKEPSKVANIDPILGSEAFRCSGDSRIGLDSIGFWPGNRGGAGVSANHVHEVAHDWVFQRTAADRYNHDSSRGEHGEEDTIIIPHPIGFHRWLHRQRLEYGIALRIPDERFRETWPKLPQRKRVWFENYVRRFPLYCQPCSDMRFISMDHKPVWFINAGQKGTLAKKSGRQPSIKDMCTQTRERYTIVTSVRSYGHDDTFPIIEIMFRGRLSELEDADRNGYQPLS